MQYGFRIATPAGVWVWTKGDYNAECCALRRDFWAFAPKLTLDDLLVGYDPAKHRHAPMLDNGTVGNET